ncbi:hypothetical protein A4X13_0g7291 [Tilletia indica]|uniref:JmjC domain-containing protein n=1 Tax=Tilletia indica TaxID=43049 RepID=A0A8T8SK82_9BASI|nr:hypothetical protein A4X13_0g7291 [Tilletia indica]
MSEGVMPLLLEEYAHAANPQQHVFQRRAEDGSTHTQCGCESFMLGGWQCVKCGTELCVTCLHLVHESEATMGGELVESTDVMACRASRTALWNPHTTKDFVPIARYSVQQLSLARALAKEGAAIYREKGDALTAEVMSTVQAEFQNEPPAAARGSPHIRRRVEKDWPRKGTSGEGTIVLRLHKTESHLERLKRVLRYSLVLKEAFVVQQDLLEPLSTNALTGLFATGTKMRVRRHVGKSVGGLPPEYAQEDWDWEDVVKELSGQTKKTDGLDIRDYPQDGDLAAVSVKACDWFMVASACPGRTSVAADGIESRECATARALGDAAAWTTIPERDAGEKCYGATQCDDLELGQTTTLHVDEAGAANVLLWVGPDREGRDTAGMDLDEVDTEDLNGRSVGAEWLWWPQEARNYFSEAATRCHVKGDHAGWEGHALYAQNLSANEAFIEQVVALGGEECRARMILQRVGETVYIPAGVAHQVRNIRPCFKIARDLMSPAEADTMLAVQRERITAVQVPETGGRDACMIRPCLMKAWQACMGFMARSEYGVTGSLWANENSELHRELIEVKRMVVEERRRTDERLLALEQRPSESLTPEKLEELLAAVLTRSRLFRERGE